MAEIIGELGYGFTIDSERCMGIMSFFSPLTESTIAKLLGTIGCTHVYPEDNLNIYSTFSSLFDFGTIADGTRPTSWNIDVLVESIKKLVSIYFSLLWLLFTPVGISHQSSYTNLLLVTHHIYC